MSETTKEERTRYKTIQLGIAANCEPLSPEKAIPPGCGMTCGFLLRLIADADRLAELEAEPRFMPPTTDAIKTYITEAVDEGLRAKLLALRASERALGEAYLRIRSKLGAWDTTLGGDDRFDVTERALDDVIKERDDLRDALDSHKGDS